MKVTIKGQVTIPMHIREKYGILPNTDVDFVEERGKIYLKKLADPPTRKKFGKYRGTGTTKMTTEEIMALTRG